jgi:hypothetical protein
MIGNLRVVTPEQLAALRAEPERVEQLLYPEEAPNGGAGLPPGPDDELYLDKSWHGIHFLLTGTDWEAAPPLGFLAGAGDPIGDVDVGYGPARGFDPAGVAEIAEALERLGHEELAARFDPAAMTRLQIYPQTWDREPADEELDYLLAYYDDLRAFVREAASRGLGLLVWIN